MKFRFHLLGLAHVPTTRKLSVCAFSNKNVRLAEVLTRLGHDVFFYGAAGSEVICKEFIECVPQKLLDKYSYDIKREQIKWETPELWKTFNINAIKGINKRKQKQDFLLCSFGVQNKPIADAVKLMTVESGIGYEGIFAEYKVFESYAWMHYLYGKQGKQGNFFDSVIPGFFDVNEFTFKSKKEDYLLFMGRLNENKGFRIPIEVAKRTGDKLILAGQGEHAKLNEEVKDYPNITFIPSVGVEERNSLMGNAKAFFCPSLYIEPFGCVGVEAQLCGTPVITTDWGVYPETVLHGVTGYRCRNLDDFIWATKNIGNIYPAKCRKWAMDNFSMEKVSIMYNEYFHRLYSLWSEGWNTINPNRPNLDWIKKTYPFGYDE